MLSIHIMSDIDLGNHQLAHLAIAFFKVLASAVPR